MPSNNAVRLEFHDNIAVLTLCRPEQKNVMSYEMLESLHAHADTLHADSTIGAVLLQSEGPMFCVGADVKSMLEHLSDLPNYVDSLIKTAHAALLRLLTLRVPVIGLLRGTAAGGGVSLALGCDVLVAARSARLALAYTTLGTTPDMGLSHALIERLGAQRAMQLFLLSDDIAIDEAHQLGLIQQVYDDEVAHAESMRLAERISRLPSAAAKELFLHRRHSELETRLELERQSFVKCSQTETFQQRVLSFKKPAPMP